VKVTFNVCVEAVSAIRSIAKRRGTTMTEVIRQAIGNEKYIDDMLDEGGRILVEDKRGHVREVLFR